MNETEHAAGAQTEPQETNLNAPSARLSAAPAPGREETHTPDRDTLRTDPVQDQADYEGLQLPEDLTLPCGALEELKDIARELGLSCGQVQKLLDFETRYARSGAQNGAEEKRQIVERWARETKALYGARCEEEISLAVRAAEAFGGPELRALLEATGLGNHPVIVRTFNEIGKSISEDVCPGGKPAAPRDKTFAEALYGKNN